MARIGRVLARSGQIWSGEAGKEWRGTDWLCKVGRGMARQTGEPQIYKGGTILVYKYKLDGLYPVQAQTAGEEIERIYHKRGQCDAADVVDESRPESAALHPCFEWDDPVAAELWREQQARGIINCIVTVSETKKGETVEVRAFPHVADTYRPLNVVLESKDMETEMKESALREFLAFKHKLDAYKSLDAVRPVIGEIDRAVRRLKGEDRSEQTV